jgi:hypothetical protein
MTSLPDLHDATLKRVDFEWDSATVRLLFKTGPDSSMTIIEADGVTRLKCPRLLPWGPSNSVNSTALEMSNDGQILMIEMQSGDTLEVCFRTVTVKSAPN